MLRNEHNGFRWTAILIALVLLAAACGDDEQDDQPLVESTDEAATSTTDASESDDPTSVVIGLEQELTNFNNLTAGDNLLAGRQIIRAVWPTCVRTLPNSTFEAVLLRVAADHRQRRPISGGVQTARPTPTGAMAPRSALTTWCSTLRTATSPQTTALPLLVSTAPNLRWWTTRPYG